ncbi:hypothetical protein [Gynuella sunshinyii]|uniref:hypothetical protein n=1 Tax=Gynuella sunshinyii TaxID=1445505 RepID=UPI003CCB876A
MGKPDLALPKYRSVIFANGCQFWAGKLNANAGRDNRKPMLCQSPTCSSSLHESASVLQVLYISTAFTKPVQEKRFELSLIHAYRTSQ